MAKGKYHKWLTPEGLILIQGWAMDGLTNEEIATKIKINPDTLYSWMKRFPEISEAIKRNKEFADQEVEQALFKKATGRSVKTVEEPRFNPKTGEFELVVVRRETLPPDVAAQAFWLKNRRPEKWRDKRELVSENTAEMSDINELTVKIFDADEDRSLDDFLNENGGQDE